MSKKKITICDICGDEIRGSYYFFLKKKFCFVDFDDDVSPCDICKVCFARFKQFVRQERKTEKED